MRATAYIFYFPGLLFLLLLSVLAMSHFAFLGFLAVMFCICAIGFVMTILDARRTGRAAEAFTPNEGESRVTALVTNARLLALEFAGMAAGIAVFWLALKAIARLGGH